MTLDPEVMTVSGKNERGRWVLNTLGQEIFVVSFDGFSPNNSISKKGTTSWGLRLSRWSRSSCMVELCLRMEKVRALSQVVPVLGKEARIMSEGRGV